MADGMGGGGSFNPGGGGGASLGDVFNALKNLVVNVSALVQQIAKAFPVVNGTTTTATAGAATLPANPVGFITTTLPNGTIVKVPYYT